MKKLKYFYVSILLISTVLTSCNYMDIVPDMVATIEGNAFSMRAQAEKYFFTCYSYLPYAGSPYDDPAMLGGDEMWLSPYNNNYSNAKNLATGAQRANEPYFDYWRGAAGGKNLYRGISDCNIFLANIDRVPDMSIAEKNRWRAEVEILKAYYHFYLIRMYGPIPIKDVNVSIEADTKATHVFRNTVDECFSYIVNKMDSIIKLEYLPEVIQDKANEAGRITKGIALVLKAKMAVYRASPLFNGNTDYRGLKDRRGIEIFCPEKTEEQKRQLWSEAAEDCKEAIDFLRSSGLASLYKYTGTEYGADISQITRDVLTLRLALTEKWNSDIIWANTNGWTNENQRQSLPRDIEAAKATNTEQRGNFAVPIKILYQFYTKNGVPIEEDKTWSYTDRFVPRTVGEDQRYRLKTTEQTIGMHFDRELRYYASIGFDGGIWFGQGTNSEDQFLQCKMGQAAANQVTHTWNVTGMFPKKLVHPKTAVSASATGFTAQQYPFPFIRLPEIFLLYAEALNEAENSQSNRDLAISYLDSVRIRAGLRGVKASWRDFSVNPSKPDTQEGLRSIIKQETLIEFAFEGHRFWDLRRWKDALREYNKPITGWNITYSSTVEYYTETLIYQTKFTPRDYFFPIHDGEILRNSNTLQNYGW